MKIDIDKFILSICRSGYGSISMGDIKAALKVQGLEYKDGMIVSIEPKFKVGQRISIEQGNHIYTILEVKDDRYITTGGEIFFYDEHHLILEESNTDVPEADFGNKELTEFEKELAKIVGFGISTAIVSPKDDLEQFAKENACKLMSIARKEFESEQHLGITRAEFESELEHLYKYADEVQYNRGHDNGYEVAKKEILEQIEQIVTNPKLFDEDRVYEIEKLIKELKGE